MKHISDQPMGHLQANFVFVFLFLFFHVPVFSQGELIQIGGGTANYLNVTVTSSSEEGVEYGENTISGYGILPNLVAASRFLGQSSLGADYETIEEVAGKGFEAWIDEQINLPYSFSQTDYTLQLTETALDSVFNNGGDPMNVEPIVEYWHAGWWKYVMTSPDILRAKVAYALSQIFVVSENDEVLEEQALSLPNYYDMLSRNAFGNYRDLLEEVTYHPAMGTYLTHVNNPKANYAINRFPDENYAREIMQLFSIGLYQLNSDGTRVLDGNGEPLPTYGNAYIAELAKVFTGFSYGDAFLFGQSASSQYSFTVPMKIYDYWHEPGPKNVLGEIIVEDNVEDEVDAALDVLFNHPNVGPFMAIRLIQRLVKSNPSPGYISRVSAVFADNGSGVRGDLGAVVKAILLDPEARDCSLFDSDTEGMLREPMVAYTHLMRAFNAASPSGQYRNDMDDFYSATSQRPLAAPTVFNFFQTDYQPLGGIQEAGKVDPVFQIINSRSTVGYANKLHDWLMENYNMEWFRLYNGEPYYQDQYQVLLDFEDEINMADDINLEQMIERLNLILVHGQMTEQSREAIYNAVSQFPSSDEDDLEQRVKIAIFLVMMSPDYFILK